MTQQGPPPPIADTSSRPEWQLPRGVAAGGWQYIQTGHIAEDYDGYFTHNQLFDFDRQVVAETFSTSGLVVDLGCGTGRNLLPLARRGFTCLGVDLSEHMLRVLGEKAHQEKLSIWRVRANLVDLDFIRTGSAQYCVCLFSTLGMVRGRQNRHRVLAHAHRILKPGGLFVIHVHNFCYNLVDPLGRRWALRHLLTAPFARNIELGDKFFHYRGIPNMFLHTFGQSGFRRALVDAGFKIDRLIPLHPTRQRSLSFPWLFGWLRANGWIAVCRKPADA
jgi:SAM-dependent methyltransferase